MRKFVMIAAIFAAPVGAVELSVPSGRAMTLYDVVMTPPMGRFRFELPAIAQGVGFADLVDDFEYLCTQVAVPALAQSGVDVTEIVISVSAAQVPFGEATDVVQYFQPYRLVDGECEWDAY